MKIKVMASSKEQIKKEKQDFKTESKETKSKEKSDSESEQDSEMDAQALEILEAYNMAEMISEEWNKHQVKPPNPLKFVMFDDEKTLKSDEKSDEKKKEDSTEDFKIISHEQEEPSETDSVKSFGNDSDEDSDDSDHEKDTEERYTWPGKMDRIIFRFCEDFVIQKCLMNKHDRKVYTALRKSDQFQCVIIVADDNVSRLREEDVPREVRLMSRIRNHPNLASILGWCSIDKKKYCILMPYYANCDMIMGIQGNMFLIHKFMKSALEGLNHLHKQNVVHRDLAKDNILWDPLKEQSVIIDFDTSAPMRPKYYRDVGRDKYDAPEKTEVIEMRKKMWDEERRKPVGKQKNKFYTSKADIYSLGVVFWMLLKNKKHSPDPPFLKKWVRKVIQRNKHKKYAELDLLVKMLMFDPKSRISVESALKHSFIVDTPPMDMKYKEMRKYLLKMHEMEIPKELQDDEEETEEKDDNGHSEEESESESESSGESDEKSD